MKRTFVIVSAFCILLLPVFTTPTFSGDKGNSSGYSFFVNGLKQFPLGYEIPDDLVLATIVGMAEGQKSPDNVVKFSLNLVTIEDNILSIEVGGADIVMTLWKHEVSPEFGKYKYWNPVLALPRKKNGAFYWYHDIQFKGRFFIIWDKQEPNKILGYKNDVFRKVE